MRPPPQGNEPVPSDPPPVHTAVVDADIPRPLPRVLDQQAQSWRTMRTAL
jgi:hypothetical protein